MEKTKAPKIKKHKLVYSGKASFAFWDAIAATEDMKLYVRAVRLQNMETATLKELNSKRRK